MMLGRPSLLGGPALSETERRNSFDNILTQSRQVDGQDKREVRSVKRGRDGMMMMLAGMNKRSRSDTGVGSRPDVQVKIDLLMFDIFLILFEKVEHKEGGGRIFTIFPPWMESPIANFQTPDLDKEMAESFG